MYQDIVLETSLTRDFTGNSIHMPLMFSVKQHVTPDKVLQLAQRYYWGVKEVFHYERETWVVVIWRPFPLNLFGMFI